MYEWSARDSVVVTVAVWAILTTATIVGSGEYTVGQVATAGLFLAFFVGVLAFVTRAAIRGILHARFEPEDAGLPTYPVTCTACALDTEYCVQKGVIVRSFVGRDAFEGETRYRMFCPDCGADFWIGKRDYERSLDAADDLQAFHDGDIDESGLADNIFSYEEDVGFIPNPDPRLKRQGSIDRDISEGDGTKGFQ